MNDRHPMQEQIREEIDRFLGRMAEFGVRDVVTMYCVRCQDGTWRMGRKGMGSPWAQEGMIREDLRAMERTTDWIDDAPTDEDWKEATP